MPYDLPWYWQGDVWGHVLHPFSSWSWCGIAGRTPGREKGEGVTAQTQLLGGDVWPWASYFLLLLGLISSSVKRRGWTGTIFSELDISFLVWILRFPALLCPTTVIAYLPCNCVNVGTSGWEFAGINTEGSEHLPTFACLWHICVLRRQLCGDFEMTQL